MSNDDLTSMGAAIIRAGGPRPIAATLESELSRIFARAHERGLTNDEAMGVLKRALARYELRDDEGQPVFAENIGQEVPAPPRETNLAGGEGHLRIAETALAVLPPARESLTEAGRTLRSIQPNKPGAGALQPRAYEARRAVMGESWLLSHRVPGGPLLLGLTYGELERIGRRMIGEGAERLLTGAVVARLKAECDKLGQISPDQIVGKTLPPAIIDEVARDFDPQRMIAKGRVVAREFVKNNAKLLGGAHA